MDRWTRQYLHPRGVRYAAQRLARGWSDADARVADRYWARVIVEMLERRRAGGAAVPFDAAAARPYPAARWDERIAFIAHALRQDLRLREDPAFATRLAPADRDAIRADWAAAMRLLVAHWGDFRG